MISELTDDQLVQALSNQIGPGRPCALVRKSDIAEVINLLDQVLGMPADISDLGIVGQIDRRRGRIGDPANRGLKFLGVKLRWRGGHKNIGALGSIKISIGNPKGVAREKRIGAAISDKHMMPGMAGRIPEFDLAACELDHRTFWRFDEPISRNWAHAAVLPYCHFGSIDIADRRPELGGVSEVLQAAGVDGDPGIRALFKQGTRAARMIQMNVGEQNPVDGFGSKAECTEGLKNAWNGILGRGIDHRNAALLNNQMNCIEFISNVARVQRKNSIVKIQYLGGRLVSSGMLMKRMGGEHKQSIV